MKKMLKSSNIKAMATGFFMVMATFQTVASGSITLSVSQLPNFRGVYPGNFSDVQFYYVQGGSLTQPLQISVVGDFMISLNCHVGYSSTVSINPSGGNVQNTRVFVRFFPQGLGAKNGSITHSSGAAPVRTVSISGSGIGSTIPIGYYSTATGSGPQLKTQLHNIINNHTMLSYSSLWEHFEQTDATFSGQVWDMYSDIPCQEPPYIFNFGLPHQDPGSGGTTEGQHFNREHSFPRSWFGASSSHPMDSDLFHIWPVDKRVNSQRANWPYGMVNNPNWSSLNGGKRGPNVLAGYSGTSFEPINAYKGDIARGFLYVVTRYQNEIVDWNFDVSGTAMLDNQTFPGFKPWALDMLRQWHQTDPVSQKEILRNHQIYLLQGNRNPFIDHPEFVERVWSQTSSINESQIVILEVFPNPAIDWIVINSTLSVFSLEIFSSCGKLVASHPNANGNNPISIAALSAGVYYLVARSKQETERARLIVVN